MWKTVLTTFALVFLAELGDKTQLSTMILASRSKSAASVFIGSACALVISSLLGVIGGTFLQRYIPQNFIHVGAGISFILIGFLLLLGKT